MKILIILALFPLVSWPFSNCVRDVEKEFNKISPHGKRIPISVKKGVFEPRSYTYRVLNKLGIDNHFQGIQKLPGENNFVITGSDLNHKQGDLVVIKNGEIIKREVLGKWPYWHPGGIQLSGNILAVPVEEYKKSEIAKIFFFNLDQIDNPKKLPVLIDIPHTKSGAVFFYQFPDGRFLIGSYNMSKVEFYFSKTSNILDGFEPKPRLTLDKKSFSLGNHKPFEFGAQNVNVIPQCDGRIFMVFFDNTGNIIDRDDIALLFSLDLSQGKKNPVNLVLSKKFHCAKSCSFAAAAGVHIDRDGNLSIYSSPRYLSVTGNKFKIVEFKKKPDSPRSLRRDKNLKNSNLKK